MDLEHKAAEFSVGIKLLDCDHREQFETIAGIQELIAGDFDRKRVAVLLRKLAAFTLSHFAMEEGMMIATNYPGLIRHSLQHQRMSVHLSELASSIGSGALPVSPNSLKLLPQWHLAHVRNEDLAYGEWLKYSSMIDPQLLRKTGQSEEKIHQA